MISARLRRDLGALAWVAAGAVPGSLLRWHWADGWQQTLLVNLLGSLLLGGLLPLQPSHPRILLVLGVGFCGSLTTFSTWMLELVDAFHGTQPNLVLQVLGLNLAGGLIAVALGQSLMRWGVRWAGGRSPRSESPRSPSPRAGGRHQRSSG